MTVDADILIVGAGAAGLMAGIWAARSAPHARIVLLDGAKVIGAKILVAGGGRCNVTHDHIEPDYYAGSSRNAIKKVLRRFDVPQTVSFFQALGVELKREPTGKLFPITDKARTVLDGLLQALRSTNTPIRHPARVTQITQSALDSTFEVVSQLGVMRAQRVIVATGGMSLPKTGSDGAGYSLLRALGHTLTERIHPALVPLLLPRDHFICNLSGLTVTATICLHNATGKRVIAFTESMLCTHFGLSGPAILDFSRHFLAAQADDPQVTVQICWLPDLTTEQAEAELQGLGKQTMLRWLAGKLPERLIRALAADAGVDPTTTGHELTREQRKQFARALTALTVPIVGNRGYNYAEVTAGGIPLSDLRLETMESRLVPGLYCCGEICDVDGQIGGYNFQWAWASGYVAGTAASQSLQMVPQR